jgi:hypothetical protein
MIRRQDRHFAKLTQLLRQGQQSGGGDAIVIGEQNMHRFQAFINLK